MQAMPIKTGVSPWQSHSFQDSVRCSRCHGSSWKKDVQVRACLQAWIFSWRDSGNGGEPPHKYGGWSKHCFTWSVRRRQCKPDQYINFLIRLLPANWFLLHNSYGSHDSPKWSPWVRFHQAKLPKHGWLGDSVHWSLWLLDRSAQV